MRYGMAVVIALLLVALGFCAHKSRRSKRSIARPVAMLIGSLMLPVAGNLVIIISQGRILSSVGYLIYFLGMNVAVFFLMRFTRIYCHLPWFDERIRNLIYSLLLINMGQLLLNPFFHHAFGLEPVEVSGAIYYRMIPFAGQVFHRFVCYGLSLTAVGIFLWKMIAAPRLYLERYAVIFFSMVFIGLWKTFYIFSRSPIDRSMVGFGFFGLLVYYFAICYRPVRLLDKMLAQVASQVFQGVFFFDAGGACVWVNRTGREAFHIDHDNYEPSAEVLTGLFGDLSGEEWVRHDEIQLDGERKYFALEKHSIRDSRGKTAGSFLSVLDETEQQAKMERDRYNATHDALTGLYSREYFYERVRETIDTNPNTTFFICSVDIKDFKMVNDIFGREFGDYVLKCLADSIRTDTGEMSICGRLAGDTFGMCIPAWRFNADIARGIMENFVVRKADAEYRLVMHEGVYEAVEPGLDVSVMFDRANMALESIKDQYNTHIAFYDDAMRQTVLWNQRISEELDAAIREGQVRPYLQAIVDQQGRAVGAEVLARWVHPTEGFLPPARFIPIFEKNGMIAQVDRYMWRCACEILAGWGDNGLFLSINVSPKDFYFMDVVGELIRLTEAYNIKASRLRVEITETLVMADEGKRIRALKDLRAAGFIVEMDDFGSGYSSLNMLKDMPVDVVKIDMVFLRKAEDNMRARIILNSIMQMTINLQLSSITEGVETEEQYASLKSMGCGMFQGYYFAKPMPLDAFNAYLAENRAATPR